MNFKLTKNQLVAILFALVSITVLLITVLAARQRQEIRKRAQTALPAPPPIISNCDNDPNTSIICGWVFDDLNKDGLRDINETQGFAGLDVKIISVDTSRIYRTVGNSGWYQSAALTAGTYQIDLVSLPADGIYAATTLNPRTVIMPSAFQDPSKNDLIVNIGLTSQVAASPTVSPNACQDLLALINNIIIDGAATCIDSSYNAAADVNKDGAVDQIDYQTMLNNSSDNAWCTVRFNDTSTPCLPTPTPVPTGAMPSLGPNCQALYDRLQTAYFTSCGDTAYDPVADLDKDGNVRATDFSLLRSNAANENWCATMLNDPADPCAAVTITVTPPVGVQDTTAPNAPTGVTAVYNSTSNEMTFEWRWNGDLPAGSAVGYCQRCREADRTTSGNACTNTSVQGFKSNYPSESCDPYVNSPFWWQTVDETQRDPVTGAGTILVYHYSGANKTAGLTDVQGNPYPPGGTKYIQSCQNRNNNTLRVDVAARDANGNIKLSSANVPSEVVSAKAVCGLTATVTPSVTPPGTACQCTTGDTAVGVCSSDCGSNSNFACTQTGQCTRLLRNQGDANGDGVVDLIDYDYYRRRVLGDTSYQASHPEVNTDFDGDGLTSAETDLEQILLVTLRNLGLL